MSKKLRFLFYGLIGLVCLLSASSVFFFLKNRTSCLKQKNEVESAASSVATGEAKIAPASQTSKPEVSPVKEAEKPSHPATTHKIEKGETLLSIAKDKGVTLAEITEANGINDQDKVLAGQTLIIPQNQKIAYTIDNTRASALQQLADEGKLAFRLDPLETVRTDAPPTYGLSANDNYSLGNRDDNSGRAEVKVKPDAGGNYLIKLIQPVSKGGKGIWAIEEISPEI